MALSDGTVTSVYPWHRPLWTDLVQQSTWHHGLLVTGVSGIGKREFCLLLGRYLLCSESGVGKPASCGQCQNCRLFNAGTHPDFHLLTSELESVETRLPLITAYGDRYQDVEARNRKAKPGNMIVVGQVRELIGQFSSHAYIAARKVALIMPADGLNANAANALLKLLEDPPGETVLILMTDAPGFLPATIRSRCMNIPLPVPHSDVALKWLGPTIGPERAKQALSMTPGPVDAMALSESGALETQGQYVQKIIGLLESNTNPVELAADLSKSDFAGFLNWFQRFLCDWVKWGLSDRQPEWHGQTRLSPDRQQIHRLYPLYDRVTFYRRLTRATINEQMAVEDLILSLWKMTKANVFLPSK